MTREITFNDWAIKFNVGKKLTEFQPFEDHNLIPQYKEVKQPKQSFIKRIMKIWK